MPEVLLQGINMNELTAYDATINILPYDRNTTIYSIIDEDSKRYEDLEFNFAVQKPRNSPPEIDFVPDVVIIQGEEFTYLLTASDFENDELTFYSKNQLVQVEQNTGLLSINASSEADILAELCVKDRFAEDCEEVLFMVENV